MSSWNVDPLRRCSMILTRALSHKEDSGQHKSTGHSGARRSWQAEGRPRVYAQGSGGHGVRVYGRTRGNDYRSGCSRRSIVHLCAVPPLSRSLMDLRLRRRRTAQTGAAEGLIATRTGQPDRGKRARCFHSERTRVCGDICLSPLGFWSAGGGGEGAMVDARLERAVDCARSLSAAPGCYCGRSSSVCVGHVHLYRAVSRTADNANLAPVLDQCKLRRTWLTATPGRTLVLGMGLERVNSGRPACGTRHSRTLTRALSKTTVDSAKEPFAPPCPRPGTSDTAGRDAG
ncbi:hypothetical protein C8Q76DRAFT_217435 [Earliella scabrosa]|nr:hypothetical protein C8Q76DRAFT_217435 [Earliella scabrosa]